MKTIGVLTVALAVVAAVDGHSLLARGTLVSGGILLAWVGGSRIFSSMVNTG